MKKIRLVLDFRGKVVTLSRKGGAKIPRAKYNGVANVLEELIRARSWWKKHDPGSPDYLLNLALEPAKMVRLAEQFETALLLGEDEYSVEATHCGEPIVLSDGVESGRTRGMSAVKRRVNSQLEKAKSVRAKTASKLEKQNKVTANHAARHRQAMAIGLEIKEELAKLDEYIATQSAALDVL